MSTRKRNEWLEADDDVSDGEAGYDSEAEEAASRGRALAGRASKRRKTEDEDESEGESEGEEREETPPPSKGGRKSTKAAAATKENAGDDERDDDDDGAEQDYEAYDEDGNDNLADPKPAKPLTQKQLLKSQKAAKRSGVVYLSRIPPFMKPATVKSLLQPHGNIGRVFLTPEDPAVYARRKAHGGNKKRSFIDGWVEFTDKRQAKAAVELLNARIIGGKKGGYYHDDVWNLRYLKGFKWHHLTEQIKNENAERAGRLRAEIARSTRENKEFIANVERAKMLGGMEAKRKKKSGGEGASAGEKKGAEEGGRPALLFRQNEVKSKKLPKENAAEQPEDVKRVLSKIF